MKERKVWNAFEDKILRYLKQERGEKKWSVIARKMEEQFQIAGRTGKQCRERYHNHLDSSIVTSEWTEHEDEALFNLHEEYGNKWSSISQNLPGRSDNCVKNRFYSKLRKSVRRLNKFILDHLANSHETISPKLLSKIIETTELRSRSSCRVDEETIEYSIDLKNRLFNFESFIEGEAIERPEEVELARQLIEDAFFFQKNIKKPGRVIRKRTSSFDQHEHFLHPKMCLKMNKSSSNASSSSDISEDLSCLSSSNISSFDDDLDEVKPRKRSMTTRSTKDVNSRNNSDVMGEQVRSNQDPQLRYKETQCELNDSNFGWIQCQKLSMSLVEQDDPLPKPHRNSISNKSNSSHHSEHYRNFDDFCEIDEHFRNHLNAEHSFSEIVWRILEPKESGGKFDRIMEQDEVIEPGEDMGQY